MKVLKSFFYSGDDFQPPYFWITVFSLLIAITIIIRLCGLKAISDGLIISMLGFVVTFAGVYNWNRKMNGHKK